MIGEDRPIAGKTYFTPALFAFLRELKDNNTREWFDAHKARYECVAKAPMLDFIDDVGPLLRRISPQLLADSRASGGSMFRIHRDVRFAKDKSPYKTALAAQFRHQACSKDIDAPGLYLHLEPDQIMIGGGLYHPRGESLYKVRCAIAAKPELWQRIIEEPRLSERFAQSGDKLRRPPTGFAVTTPLIEEVKRKDFVALAALDEATVCGADFLAEFERHARMLAPLLAYLSRAIGLAW
ncbi:MAG: TIGR02453 family protein [Candidatus Accumulibacter sp.]|uniref:DUF2461 domain-containing protein n=1 Tax=Accumulibacter sp. TaxID=2053492 RepID=UPI0025F5A60C|nr:TIGR02453 family protein [Accumulibacter sp.]MCP5248568.1 TIGR02453 family protein [Accumulibacter sp.]